MMEMFSEGVGRKFIFAILVTVLGFVLVLTNHIKAQDWQNFTMIIGGLYITGNLIEKKVN